MNGPLHSPASRPRLGSTKSATLAILAFALALGIVAPAAAQIPADVVYGQLGSFTTAATNDGGVSANSLGLPSEVALYGSGNLYVADSYNSRVLFYPAGSTAATQVYGQSGSFTTDTINNGGVSPNSLDRPNGVALDSSGNLYVADTDNSRVLFYPAGSTTATQVYGQGGSFTTNTANNGGVSANSLSAPSEVALDSNGNLYVADTGNARVLFYPAGSTTATAVYGKSGSFTRTGCSEVTANSLCGPWGVALDSNGNLYVADTNNGRVLFYPAGSTTATQVYGQGGSFTTNGCNKVNANTLCGPWAAAPDSNGNLYIADSGNSRVLFYPAGSTTPTQVYGQASFTVNVPNKKGVSAISLSAPGRVTLDSSGNLYVADRSNNRVLEFPAAAVTLTPPSLAFGNVVAAAASPAKSVTLLNAEHEALVFGNIAASGDFAVSSTTCGSTLAVGKICTIKVTLTPPVLGALTGNLMISDNASGSPQTLPLTGTGTAQATLTPATETYGAQTMGTTSKAKVFTLANKQSAPLTSIVISTTGDFNVSSTTCSTSLAARANCKISVVFTPTATGTTTGTLQVSDPAIGSPQTSSLTGTGK